ncbi:MAG: sulfurtransferase complex subunit TusC [Bermanella sp.]|nr:sulfurtransferase complex subunit TusC [Bermanella sp.]
MNTTTTPQDILILQRQAPYGSSIAREGLDFILTSAAYDQNLSVLFLTDGVFQLLTNQNSKAIGLKNHAGALEVLPLYDIENLYAVSEDLMERSINPSDILAGVNIINREQAKQLIEQHTKVIGF